MASIKLDAHIRELSEDFFLGESKGATDNGHDPVRICGNEGADDDTCALGQQLDFVTANGNTHGVGRGGVVIQCSAEFISASAR